MPYSATPCNQAAWRDDGESINAAPGIVNLATSNLAHSGATSLGEDIRARPPRVTILPATRRIVHRLQENQHKLEPSLHVIQSLATSRVFLFLQY